MEYEPSYAQGQVLVVFNEPVRTDFARDFGKTFGYELADEEYNHGEAYIFLTEVGRENEAIDKFAQYSDFVNCAGLRDEKLEARWEGLEQATTEIQNLQDDASLPDNLYRKKLEGIVDHLKQLLD
jgi:hypothetical protein